MNKGKIIIISSPSGAGKTTICKRILKLKRNIKLSISYTTRPKRVGERNGIDYHFVSQKKFNYLKKKNYFIESAKVFGYYYGSPYGRVSKIITNNEHILFDIDWQGATKLRKKFNKTDIIDFFILPPNKKELKNRLIKRARENKLEIKKRLSLAVKEIKHLNEYKYLIINDKINLIINNIIKIIKHEEFISSLNKDLRFWKKF